MYFYLQIYNYFANFICQKLKNIIVMKSNKLTLLITAFLLCHYSFCNNTKLFTNNHIHKSEKISDSIIINEILFNPISPGVDYIELYNNSINEIDICNYSIGRIRESFPNPPDTSLKVICSESYILPPKSYVLLSTNSEMVSYQYVCSSDNFLEMKSFPSLPNDEAMVILCNQHKDIIDEMFYSDKMHHDLLIETKGVALERISFDNSSLDRNNWTSASYTTKYGTPGYRNSMAVDLLEEKIMNEINIIPEIFSPNGDGRDDICSINYMFDKNGYNMNIKIFNSKGIFVKNLLNNSLIDNKGSITWNGGDDNNRILDPGIYIIQAEIFDLKGYVNRIRKVVVIAP